MATFYEKTFYGNFLWDNFLWQLFMSQFFYGNFLWNNFLWQLFLRQLFLRELFMTNFFETTFYGNFLWDKFYDKVLRGLNSERWSLGHYSMLWSWEMLLTLLTSWVAPTRNSTMYVFLHILIVCCLTFVERQGYYRKTMMRQRYFVRFCFERLLSVQKYMKDNQCSPHLQKAALNYLKYTFPRTRNDGSFHSKKSYFK